jgi:hypothetical protein
MSYSRAINEIAGLLTQAGTPANHANDIASRLAFALSDYYDYRIASAGSKDVTNGSDQTSSFKRAFAPPEATRPGTPGANGTVGADGRWAWAAGKDGTDGVDGGGGDGSGNNGGGSGGGGITIFLPPTGNVTQCAILKSLLKSCGICSDPCGSSKSYEGKCSTGEYAGLEICSILEQQANELKKIRERLDAIEKQLKDTVDC